jgi:hypothetical protein
MALSMPSLGAAQHLHAEQRLGAAQDAERGVQRVAAEDGRGAADQHVAQHAAADGGDDAEHDGGQDPLQAQGRPP